MINASHNTLDIARDYHGRGWQVLPLARGRKEILRDEWQHLRFTHEELDREFATTCNIGVLTGECSGIVDIDLDHELAVELADNYLPATASEFGRPSKLRSHRIFRVKGKVATKKFYLNGTNNKKTVVEFRSEGCQAALIQSTLRHESRARLLERLVRKDLTLSLADRVSVLREIGNATDSRDKCLSRLGLDTAASRDPWATLDAQTSQNALNRLTASQEGK